jgi:hypothetical protein
VSKGTFVAAVALAAGIFTGWMTYRVKYERQTHKSTFVQLPAQPAPVLHAWDCIEIDAVVTYKRQPKRVTRPIPFGGFITTTEYTIPSYDLMAHNQCLQSFDKVVIAVKYLDKFKERISDGQPVELDNVVGAETFLINRQVYGDPAIEDRLDQVVVSGIKDAY